VDQQPELAKPVLIDALKDDDPAIRAAAAEVLKKIDPEVVAKAGAENGGKKNPTTDLSDAEVVAKAFITALANQNVAEAAKYIIPEERDELKEGLNNPHFPVLRSGRRLFDTLAPDSCSVSNVTQAILTANGTLQSVKATVPAGSAIPARYARLKVISP
jgi:hypothetical protein